MASNPIVQTSFTADPAPMVHDGVVYLYTSHDDDNAPPGQGRFLMRDWKCYSSTDMVNWTDHGSVLSLKTFPWAVQENDAWAPHAIERNGKFYFYAPISVEGWPKNVIAVAVADHPLGPFKDVLGRPLIDKKTGYIDPGVFIDDDGQAYLYFGNPQVWYVKLNEDMISYTGEIVRDPSFAKERGRGRRNDPFHYQEAPWPFKRNGKYYMAYAATCCPEGIGYAMSDSPTGPWEFKGYIMPPDKRATGNHPGIIHFIGNDYRPDYIRFSPRRPNAVHDAFPSRPKFNLKLNPNRGTIQELPWWEEANPVAQIGSLNPYTRCEGETICWSEGMKSEPCDEGGMGVYPTREGAYLKVQGVNFGDKGPASFQAHVASANDGGTLEIRLEGPAGPLLGSCDIPNTGGAQTWKTVDCPIEGIMGVHDLSHSKRVRKNALVVDWWQFKERGGAR